MVLFRQIYGVSWMISKSISKSCFPRNDMRKSHYNYINPPVLSKGLSWFCIISNFISHHYRFWWFILHWYLTVLWDHPTDLHTFTNFCRYPKQALLQHVVYCTYSKQTFLASVLKLLGWNFQWPVGLDNSVVEPNFQWNYSTQNLKALHMLICCTKMLYQKVTHI